MPLLKALKICLMPKLLTITFSPCIDKSVRISDLLPEKKTHCSDPVIEPGGGGINIARAINKLGYAAIAVYPAGGCRGETFNQLLRQEAVPIMPIETSLEMRENLNVADLGTGRQYRFVMPGVALFPQELKGCMDAIQAVEDPGFIIVSGSLPPGLPATIFQELGKIAREKKARLIVDTSKEALQQLKGCGVFLIKPNLAELGVLSGRKDISQGQVETVAREVIENGYCEIVVVSIGATGAMLITRDMAITAIPPVIQPKSTVGAGDSLVAGLVIAISEGRKLDEAIRYGVACGTAACLNEGTALCNPDDVARIYSKTKINKA